jgi:two-component system, response regulator PdtaR
MYQKVCVVEDDPFLRIDAVSLLEDAGLPVEQFATADQAIAYLEANAHRVVFIFTDVRMPGSLDGVSLARMIDKRWPWIKVVVTSAATSAASSQLPANSTFMRKPWRPGELLAHAVAAQ